MRPAFEIQNILLPSQAPKCVSEEFDFSVAQSFVVDLLLDQNDGAIDFVQSIYIDNSSNAKSVTVSAFSAGFPFQITAAPFTQGFYPFVTPKGRAAFQVSGTVGKADILFLNIPMPYTVWTIQNAGGAASTGNDINHSGTLAAANVSQVAIPANANRIRAIIQNPFDAPASLWIAFDTPATENNLSEEIAPGQTFDTAGGALDLGDITIIGANAGAFYYASEIVKA